MFVLVGLHPFANEATKQTYIVVVGLRSPTKQRSRHTLSWLVFVPQRSNDADIVCCYVVVVRAFMRANVLLLSPPNFTNFHIYKFHAVILSQAMFFFLH